MSRITVYENGSDKNGKVIGVGGTTMKDCLIKIGIAFKTDGFKRLFTLLGAEITAIEVLR